MDELKDKKLGGLEAESSKHTNIQYPTTNPQYTTQNKLSRVGKRGC